MKVDGQVRGEIFFFVLLCWMLVLALGDVSGAPFSRGREGFVVDAAA